MKQLYICDVTDTASATPICRANGFGIEVQAFCDPSAFDDHDSIARNQDMIKGIPGISIHGPFGDLCADSFDSDRRAQEIHSRRRKGLRMHGADAEHRVHFRCGRDAGRHAQRLLRGHRHAYVPGHNYRRGSGKVLPRQRVIFNVHFG